MPTRINAYNTYQIDTKEWDLGTHFLAKLVINIYGYSTGIHSRPFVIKHRIIFRMLFNNYSPKAKWLSVNIHRAEVIIPKTKRKSVVKHENILFHQKRGNNWQPFCSSRWLSAVSRISSMIIENRALWLATIFALSRCNHAVIARWL